MSSVTNVQLDALDMTSRRDLEETNLVDERVVVRGAAMTSFNRRDLSPQALAQQALADAIADARIEPDELGLVVASNATGGRLNEQGCVRGQAWLRKSGLGNVPVINVDNSCAGGSSAIHLGLLAARSSHLPVLVIGVEKMWTGDRSATLAGIEDGLPADYRADLHARLGKDADPAMSVLMGLNARWAEQHMKERGSTVRQIAAAAAKARSHAARNPLAQWQQTVTIDEVLASPPVAGVLTRLMCSSFTDGAAAVVLQRSRGQQDDGPYFVGSLARSGNGDLDYHERLTEVSEAAWNAFGIGPEDFDLVELHDATSAEELFALESLGFFAPGEAGPATLAGATTIGGPGITVNPSGGLVGRGHPLGATGIAQLVELVTQLEGRAGQRQVEGARLGVAINTGGVIDGDAGYVGIFCLGTRKART